MKDCHAVFGNIASRAGVLVALLTQEAAHVAVVSDNSAGRPTDQGIGRRACELIDSILIKSKALFGALSALRQDLDAVLAAMVRVGVAEAARCEREIEASVGNDLGQ